jgi:hypothetical protein
MTIYSPDKTYFLDYQGILKPEASFQNNAQLTLPFTNSLFFYSSIVVPDICNSLNCKPATIYDIGKIEPGEIKSLSISFSPENKTNFTFRIYSYVNTFNRGIFYKQKEISCLLNESITYQKTYVCKTKG